MIFDFKEKISGFNNAIDLGAGIGRVAKTILIPIFNEVDIVEPSEV
jgi:hypothetical protein